MFFQKYLKTLCTFLIIFKICSSVLCKNDKNENSTNEFISVKNDTIDNIESTTIPSSDSTESSSTISSIVIHNSANKENDSEEDDNEDETDNASNSSVKNDTIDTIESTTIPSSDTIDSSESPSSIVKHENGANEENENDSEEDDDDEDDDETDKSSKSSVMNDTIEPKTSASDSSSESVTTSPYIASIVHRENDLNGGKDKVHDKSEDEDEDSDEHTESDETDETDKTDKTKVETNGKDNEEDEYDDDDEDNESENDSCDGRLSTFVRTFDTTPYLPPDYEQLQEQLHSATSMDDDSTIYNQVHHINDTIAILTRLYKYGLKLKEDNDLKETLKYLSSVSMDKFYEARISPECTADLIKVMQGVRNGELWAMRIPDSFGQILLSGILRGHLSSFGEFDQCIRIKSPALDSSGETSRHIYGRYCQLQMRTLAPPLDTYTEEYENIIRAHHRYPQILKMAKEHNFDNYLNGQMVKFWIEAAQLVKRNFFHLGVCFPHTCSSVDIQGMFNQFLYPITKILVKVNPELCEDHEEIKEYKLDDFQITAIITISILSILVIVSTIYGICRQNHPKPPKPDPPNGSKLDLNRNEQIITKFQLEKQPPTLFQQIALSFSAVENSKLLGIIDNRYAVLDTIRCGITFVMSSVHSFAFGIIFTPQLLRSVGDTAPNQILHENRYWFIRMPGLWSDGFMFTIGVTIIFQQFTILQQNKFNFIAFILKPWFRMSISMIGIILAMYIYPLTGNGPMWFVNEQFFVSSCKSWESLSSSFLFFSNWNMAFSNYTIEPGFPICNPSTWFLSMSTQLYLLTPLIFLALYYRPKLGLALISTILIISPLLIIFPRLFLELPSYIEFTKLTSLSEVYRSVLHYHLNPLQYVTSLTIGLLTGYLIKRNPDLDLFQRKWGIWLWWCSFSSVIAIFIWHCSFWEINLVQSAENVMSWFVVSKFVFPLFLGYTTYLCCTNKSDTLTYLFTFPLIQPIAKLSFEIYLLRSITIFNRFTSIRRSYEMYYWQTFQNLTADYMFTIILAYLLYILFEAPTYALWKIWENRKKRKVEEAKLQFYQVNIVSTKHFDIPKIVSN